jgi:hypothetical protein
LFPVIGQAGFRGDLLQPAMQAGVISFPVKGAQRDHPVIAKPVDQ